jgi:hypothetical protein
VNRSAARTVRDRERADRKAGNFEEKAKAAPHAFFIKHGGRTLKNPHYIPAAKRKAIK